ncbi:MAG TPA: SigB/SigF/SigG family RNA polymerase sigma factor [Solirubrobacteraceae bacterium]|jgi:RNA polymerase sigma-B factor
MAVATPPLQGQKVAFLVAQEGVEEAQLADPWQALQQAGAIPLLLAPERGEVQAFKRRRRGARFHVDAALDEAQPEQYDALVLPGGPAHSELLETDVRALGFVRRIFSAGKPVGTICHGPRTLIEADLVRGRRLTSPPSMRTKIRNAGGTWLDEAVVIDRGLVSARKLEDLPAFCTTLVKQFAAASARRRKGRSARPRRASPHTATAAGASNPRATNPPTGAGTLTATELRSASPALLFKRLRSSEDKATHAAVHAALVERFLPLAHKLARRYMRSSEPYDDLSQVASLGLLKAIDRFDPDRGTGFSSFAIPTISGELKRYFRDAAWSVHVPRGAQERALAVEETNVHLTSRDGRAPNAQQIADHMHLSVEQVLDGLQAGRAYDTLSLDAPRSSGGGEEDDLATVGATLGREDERFELIDADVTLAAAVHHLPQRERRILHLRFVEDMTQNEIADVVGVSQMQVSRLLRRSIGRLRELADDATLPGVSA